MRAAPAARTLPGRALPGRALLGLLGAVWLALAAGAAGAFSLDTPLADPALEARARALHAALRCPVCQGQSLADSDAGLARDLRAIVRERLAAGATDGEVLAFLAARYGDYVLLEPPVKPATWALWFGPAAVFVAGAGLAWLLLRRRARADGPGAEAAPLSAEERRRLAALLDDER